MLLTESENAKVLRKIMLDIVIDFVNQKQADQQNTLKSVIRILSVPFCRKKIIEENLQMLFANFERSSEQSICCLR